MRSFLTLGLLIVMCASSNAATLHHSRAHHHVNFRHSQIFRHSFDLAVPAVRYDDTPSYNDPSKFGGGAP
jgi:hypothetical protein